MKHLLKMSALTPAELTHILDVADQLKAQQAAGGTQPLLSGRSVALMFSKASTRTRASFAVGVWQLGGLGLLPLVRSETMALSECSPMVATYL